MLNLMVKNGDRYRKATPGEIADVHASYVVAAVNRTRPSVSQPRAAVEFLRNALSMREHEIFVAIALDNRYRVIHMEEMFRGTVDGASVHPREVVKFALANNAAAMMFAHNLPSGVAEPSQADRMITARLRDALAMVDIRVTDHIIIGLNSSCSFAERGLI